jgi:cytochrome b pre-mRNA-processing protein 3
MLAWFRRDTELTRKARGIYGAIVAAARQPRFYREHCVPDTPEGRLEMLTLHLVAGLMRLDGAGVEGKALARLVTETFVTDMDDNMREIGIGDLAVPRKVKRAAALLYERHRAYAAALGDETLLAEQIGAACAHLSASPPVDAAGLARYLQGLSLAYAGAGDDDILAGRLPLL